MSLLNKTKFIYGTIGSTVSISTGVGAFYLLNKDSQNTKNNIGNKLKEVGYLVLNDEKQLWEEVLEEYNKKIEEKDIFEGSILSKETIDGLKSKCRLAISSGFENEANYKLAKKWCVKAESIKDMLTRNNFSQLGESTKQENKAKWEEKVRKVKEIQKERKNIDLDFKGNDGDTTILEDRCKSLDLNSSKTYSENDFEENYKIFRDWCSIENTN